MTKRLFALLLALTLLGAAVPAAAEDTQYGYVNIDTSLYTSASENAVVQAKVSLGTQVRVEEELEEDGVTWYRVTLIASQNVGWMKAEDVDLVIARRLGKEDEAAETSADAAAADEETKPAGPQKVENEKDFKVLRASGKVDPDKLQGAPKASDYKALSLGDSGSRVDKLKARLVELGYMGNTGDSKITNQDINAVKRFQKINGLTEDGVISKKLQVKLFSTKALNSQGETHNPDVVIFSNAVAAVNNAGGYIQFSVRNTGSEKIDAFDYRFRFWNTYGDRYLLKSASDDATLTDELVWLDASEERTTLGKGSAATYTMKLNGMAIPKGQIAITAYHTESGKTVRIDDDQLNWYSFEKGGKPYYEGRVVTPLTSKEISLAKGWDCGVTGSYVDAEIAEAYGLREGLYVTKVAAGSPAAEAGLQKGDILLAIGSVRIFGASSIVRAESYIKAGKSAVMLYLHNGAVYQSEIVRPK